MSEGLGTIGVNFEAGVLTVTLDRPDRLNAIDTLMLSELAQVLDGIGDRYPARALVLTGTGKAFSSGADLSDPGIRMASILEQGFNPLIERLDALPLPVMAVVNGPAVGVGCSIALAADIVVAGRSAYFLLPFAKVALVPDGGATWRLPRLIGIARAKAAMMLSERIAAEQAEEWGLIHRCFDDYALPAAAADMAARLAASATIALGLTKRGIASALETDLHRALADEAFYQREAAKTADYAEAIEAFGAKRAPEFAGR